MDIFVINTSDADYISPELLEKFRHKEFSNADKLKEHCLSYLMLDRILKEVYKTENRKIIFVNKKPYLATREKFFSLSHSGKYIVICFSDYECGIDIEKIKNRNFNAISDRMNFRCSSLDEFYFEWTKYEAEYKMGEAVKSFKQIQFQDYAVTAVSNNIGESFDIYIQNGENFSNL